VSNPPAERFTIASRASLRDELIEWAHDDVDVVGAALVGSAARGAEDQWSDIDLVLSIATGADPDEVAARWTQRLAAARLVADTLDVRTGEGVLYRVFLLADSLQVDISFWPSALFRATEEGFHLLFGASQEPTSGPDTDARHVIGMAWLYALHARSAIARGRSWQAVMMLDHLRDEIIALASLRLDLNPHHGRDADRLPDDLLARLAVARARSLEPDELRRANAAHLELLLDEVAHVDAALAARLSIPAAALARP
jgi:predicted nucleotidyltransferase